MLFSPTGNVIDSAFSPTIYNFFLQKALFSLKRSVLLSNNTLFLFKLCYLETNQFKNLLFENKTRPWLANPSEEKLPFTIWL